MADDRTSFLIELAAKFSGGDTAVATVATLGDRMLAGGAAAKDFEAATKATSSALEEAAKSAKLAGEAMAEGETKYAAAETAADRAAKAVERIGQMAAAQQGKLKAALDAGDEGKVSRIQGAIGRLAEKQGEAATKATAATAALKAEAVALDALKLKAEGAGAKHDDLKKGLANVKSAAAESAKAATAAAGSGKVNEMAEAFAKLGGPAGVAGQKVFGVASGFTKLRAAMGSGGPYVAMAVAIVAIASAAFIAAIGISKWGVSMADANRSQALLSQGVAQSVAGGDELNSKIAELSKTVPATRQELVGMAGELAKTGLRGKELSDALETSAVKAAKLKFGPEFGKQMLSLDVQSRRFGENLSDTFGGLKIEGLLEGMSTLGSLFDSSTSSGKALKFLFESLFQPLIDGAVAAIPKIERLFLYGVILALKAYIALKPYSDIFVFIGKAALVVAGVIGGTLLAAVVILAAIMAASVAVWTALAFAVYGLVSAIIELVTNPMEALKGFLAFMSQLGTDLVTGLANGIKAGASAVYDALAGVVNGAIDGAKKLLGIASPSTVFAGIGENTAAGFSEGVESGAGDAKGSLESMVAPPKPAGGGARAAGGISFSIGVLNVKGENAKEQAFDFIDQITAWLEGEGIALGGGEVPA